jgi:hypothetical protein
MDIKRETCDIWTCGGERNLYFSTHQHWYTCPIALPVRRNPQHKSLLTVVSATSAPPSQPLRHQRNIGHPLVNRFTRQTLPIVSRKHFFMIILWTVSFCPQKETRNRRLLFGITLPKHGRHFYYWNQPLNMCMSRCYIDCYEAGLCCYLVITDRKPITSITAVYFHLWPVYWLSLVLPSSN